MSITAEADNAPMRIPPRIISREAPSLSFLLAGAGLLLSFIILFASFIMSPLSETVPFFSTKYTASKRLFLSVRTTITLLFNPLSIFPSIGLVLSVIIMSSRWKFKPKSSLNIITNIDKIMGNHGNKRNLLTM